MNTFGKIFTLTSFGESHGPAIGGVIDGVPAGIPVETGYIQRELARRRPGQSAIVTQRNEPDEVEILSGVLDGVSTGAPIGFLVRNTSQRSADYREMEQALRPSHADFTYQAKYGRRHVAGGGRSSARETIARVVAGAIARKALEIKGITIYAYTSAVGREQCTLDPLEVEPHLIDTNAVRCPDSACAARMRAAIEAVQAQGDTLGGMVTCVVKGLAPGIGEPVFGKLHARLGAAMLSINAAKGFEYGMGFEGCCSFSGSQCIDNWVPCTTDPRGIRALSNNSGGIQGGISNGEPIVMRVAFKPVATLLRPVNTVDLRGQAVTLKARGRHDPCVVPRAVPIVEAMAAITLLDSILIARASQW